MASDINIRVAMLGGAISYDSPPMAMCSGFCRTAFAVFFSMVSFVMVGRFMVFVVPAQESNLPAPGTSCRLCTRGGESVPLGAGLRFRVRFEGIARLRFDSREAV